MKEQPSASPHPGSKWRLPALSWVFGGAEPTEPPAAQLHRLSWAVRCAEPKRTPPFAFTALLRAGRPPPHHSPPALRAHPPHPPVCHEAPELRASSSSSPPQVRNGTAPPRCLGSAPGAFHRAHGGGDGQPSARTVRCGAAHRAPPWGSAGGSGARSGSLTRSAPTLSLIHI